jgi:hypothetical protein
MEDDPNMNKTVSRWALLFSLLCGLTLGCDRLADMARGDTKAAKDDDDNEERKKGDDDDGDKKSEKKRGRGDDTKAAKDEPSEASTEL